MYEHDRVFPENLIIGNKYYITNLGLDGNYTVNLDPNTVYIGTVSEYNPDAGRIDNDEHIYPSIGLSKLINTSDDSVLSYNYIKGWNIHHENHHPKFYLF